MYSLNVPVPGRVKRLAADLRPRLAAFDRVRERHTLVVKRFESGDYDRVRERVRPVLAGTPAFEARVARINRFERPVRGPGPVVYLAVESPGLVALHGRLVGEFGAIPALEGDEYTPHVTLARDGGGDAASDLAALDTDPIEWTVSELAFWDGTHNEVAGRISLPA